MSDVIVYNSPSMGSVRLTPSNHASPGYDSIAKVERQLSELAGSGLGYDEFFVTHSDHAALAREMARRSTLAERDEWKRRAEAAEADLAAWKSGKRSLLRDFIERGPSAVAALSAPRSEPHAHLDEDLLCDDA